MDMLHRRYSRYTTHSRYKRYGKDRRYRRYSTDSRDRTYRRHRKYRGYTRHSKAQQVHKVHNVQEGAKARASAYLEALDAGDCVLQHGCAVALAPHCHAQLL